MRALLQDAPKNFYTDELYEVFHNSADPTVGADAVIRLIRNAVARQRPDFVWPA